MEERKFSGLSLTVIALLLVVLAGTGVYAYYASQITGNAEVRALNYAFTVNEADTEQTQTFNIAINGNEIEPGTAVRIPVSLGTLNSEVDVDYTIRAKYAASSVVIDGLHICKGAVTADATAGTTCGASDTVNIAAVDATEGNIVTNGTIGAKTTEAPFDFYLVWPWGEASEEEALNYADKTIILEVEVSGKQADSYRTN